MIDDPAWSAKPNQSAPVAYLTGSSGGNLRNDFSGYVGIKFTPNATISVKSLGRWIISGNSQNHTLVILKTADCSVQASVVLQTSGKTSGAVAYTNLASAFTMVSGTEYAVLSSETSGGDQFYDNRAVTHTSITGIASRYGSLGLGTSCFGSADTDVAYVPTSFAYTQ